MASSPRINRASGLPATVDVTNPAELQRTLEQILETLRMMNGETPQAGARVVTLDELNQRLG